MANSSRPEATARRNAAAVFLILLGVYLAFASLRVDNIDTSLRLRVARSIVEQGALDIAKGAALTPFGLVGSFQGQDGRYYSVYGIGQSLLMLPLAALGPDVDVQLVPLINPVAAALTCALLVLIGDRLRYSIPASTLLGLSCGIATLVWAQSKQTFEAPLEMLCLVGAIDLLLQNRGRRHDLSAGACVGFALLMRSSAIPMVGGLLWLLCREQGRFKLDRLPAFITGIAPLFALALWYNTARWGHPLSAGYSLTEHEYFALSIVPLSGLLLSPGRGLFFLSPLLLLVPWGLGPFFERHRDLAISLCLITAGYLVFLGFVTTWSGDWNFGSRHSLPIVPVLALFLLPLLEPGRLRRPILWIVTGAGIAVQWVGVSVNYEHYFYWLQRNGFREAKSQTHHFALASSQVWVQAQQSVAQWGTLEERLATYDPDAEPSPLKDPLLGPSPITRQVPDFWWIYLPMVGVSGAVVLGLGLLCAMPLVGGLVLLRCARPRPPPTVALAVPSVDGPES